MRSKFDIIGRIKDYILHQQAMKIMKNKPQDRRDYNYDTVGMDWEKGSDAQISWAEDLVETYVQNIKAEIQKSLSNNEITSEEAKDLEKTILHEVVMKDNASFWINKRFYRN